METFKDWRDRLRMNSYYRVGISMVLTLISWMVGLLEDPANPEIGLRVVANIGFFAAIVLWFWGCYEQARSKGLPPAYLLLSFLYVPGFMILMATPEDRGAFGPPQASEAIRGGNGREDFFGALHLVTGQGAA